MRERAKQLFAEYGVAALILHYVIFGATIGTVWLALRAGWRPRSFNGQAGLLMAAYAVTKLTMPFRLVATAALVPLVARLWERLIARWRPAAGTPAVDATLAPPADERSPG